MLPLLLLTAVICLSLLFLCIPRVFVLMHQHNPWCWWVLLLLFLTRMIMSGSTLENKAGCIIIDFLVLWSISLLSILRMILNILQERLTRCLFLWLNFCCKAWFQESFLFFWGTLFLFFISSLFFDGVSFQYFQVLVIFFIFESSGAFLI